MTDLRQALIATACAMQPAGLNRGTAGNVSVRHGDGFYITPTGMAYGVLDADDIPLMALDGSHHGRRKPRTAPLESVGAGPQTPPSECANAGTKKEPGPKSRL